MSRIEAGIRSCLWSGLTTHISHFTLLHVPPFLALQPDLLSPSKKSTVKSRQTFYHHPSAAPGSLAVLCPQILLMPIPLAVLSFYLFLSDKLEIQLDIYFFQVTSLTLGAILGDIPPSFRVPYACSNIIFTTSFYNKFYCNFLLPSRVGVFWAQRLCFSTQYSWCQIQWWAHNRYPVNTYWMKADLSGPANLLN